MDAVGRRQSEVRTKLQAIRMLPERSSGSKIRVLSLKLFYDLLSKSCILNKTISRWVRARREIVVYPVLLAYEVSATCSAASAFS
jgi:hypothetical protein